MPNDKAPMSNGGMLSTFKDRFDHKSEDQSTAFRHLVFGFYHLKL